ncbi:bromodomain-containing protein 4-like [Liolophura sinensis]|uniref:bromodomain-containing protein 4-like n=1 Tax=Liolophura sinensis TaxID=3198878 RepID=UPI0031582E3F
MEVMSPEMTDPKHRSSEIGQKSAFISTPPPGVTNKLIPKNETYSKHIAGSGLKTWGQICQSESTLPSHRPSVIQHTQKIKPAHQNSPGPKAAAHSIDQRLSGPHPATSPPPPRQALPAHSNHLKRSYPPYLDPAGLGQPIHHISPYHYTPQQNSQPLHSTMKRPRLQDPSSPHYYLAQMRTLAGDYVGKVRASAASDTRLTQPKPSHQPAIPRHNPIDEQPTDLSLKKKPNSDVLDMSKTRNSTPTRDIPPHVYHLSPSESHQRPLSRTMPSSSSSPKPAVVKRVDRASSCSPLAVNRQVSPVPSRGQKTELDKLPSAHTMSPDLAMAAKTFPLSSDASHMLHPAFPHSYLSPSIVPQRILHISPQQHVHSMYEAQMRANVAQAAAYDEMVKLNMSHIQGSPSPSAHTSQGAYSHSRTASPRHTYPK